MSDKEATARIKINELLNEAGWRFLDNEKGKANVRLEPNVKIKPHDLDELGEDFDKVENGFVDYLLLDDKGHPLLVLEAKSEDKDPLVGKEQARKYARSLDCRFVMLSNGNLHYFWDLEQGNPHTITSFPAPESVKGYEKRKPDRGRLVNELVNDDYIALTQMPNYEAAAAWRIEAERGDFIQENRLRFLRPYQLEAVHALQRAVRDGEDRFLFEMATGTGKTLTAAAIVKLFLKTGNAHRVLFLVDRLELENQATKAFTSLLRNDFKTVIFKQNRDDWQRAEIVVTTVQSLMIDNKFRRLFSPTDFDLVISDEAHRSINGNARAVFDYFVGYKLGLTATPRDFLKNFDAEEAREDDPRALERRLLRDTYRTFGCDSGQPTFRYALLDGVKDGYLVNPTVVDARTEITTELLAEQGLVVSFTDEEGEDQEQAFKQRDFEKRFFSGATNQILCKAFLENALTDPISGEIGKSIVFAVSQKHAGKLTHILNEMADRMFPGKYQSDFAVQVTSMIQDAQQFAVNFANNNLMGSGNFYPQYKTSKARVCVTVGMMTTGYDCTDLLNLSLFRPIYSPTDFIQIKGRGTRKHDFRQQLFDDEWKETAEDYEKTTFKLFDFFANCEYFENEFDYDQVLKLPAGTGKVEQPYPSDATFEPRLKYEHEGVDVLATLNVQAVGGRGMKIDRMYFDRFAETVRDDPEIASAVEQGQWDRVIDLVNEEVFDKPNDYYSLEKLRKATEVDDRRVTLREILEKVFGLIPRLKSKDEILEEEFAAFVAEHEPHPPSSIPVIRHFFKAYASNGTFRDIIDQRRFTELATNPMFSTRDYKAVPEEFRSRVPEYIKDYVSLNQFSV